MIVRHWLRCLPRREKTCERVRVEVKGMVPALSVRCQATASSLERQNAGLSGQLARQREDTRKAGLLFMDAADRYQEEAKMQISAKAEELESTRKASLLFMDTDDAYQEAARREMKVKAEEMEDARRAVVMLMEAADAYQQEAKKQIRGKVEELNAMAARNAELGERVEALESGLRAALKKNQELEGDCGKVKVENGKLRLKVERLVMELGALVGEKDSAADPFDAGKEDLKMKVEVAQANKDLMKGENGN